MTGGGSTRYGALIGAGLLAAVLLVYDQVRGHGFVLIDEDVYLTGNPIMQQGLTWATVCWAWRYPSDLGLYHPLTVLSHLLDVTLFGMARPGLHHFMSVALHAASTLLLFGALCRMTGARWRSAFVAAVFALHPLHVESVAWAAERKDVLAGLFFMLALRAYPAYAARPRAARYGLVAGAMAAGLLSKASVVTLPCVLLLLDWWPLGRLRLPGIGGHPRPDWVAPCSTRRALLEKLPLLAMAALAIPAGMAAQHARGALSGASVFPWGVRVLNACASYATYVRQAFWPAGLAHFYPHPYLVDAEVVRAPWFLGLAGCGIVLLAGGLALGLARARTQPWLLVGWLWFCGMLTPMIGLVQIGGFGHADRCTYLPLTGLAIVAAWGGASLMDRRISRGLGVAVVVAMLLLAHRQAGYWRDSETLCRRAIEAAPDNPGNRTNLGLALALHGDYPGAIAQYEAAIRLDPGFSLPYNNLGNVLRAQGQSEAAEDLYRKAVELAPDAPEPHHNLGFMRMRAGDLDAAAAHLETAVALRPDYTGAWWDLAQVRLRRGETDAARAAIDRVLELDPDHAEARAAAARL